MVKRKAYLACITLIMLSGISYSQKSNTIFKEDKLSSFLKFKAGWNTGLEWEQKTGSQSVINVFAGILIAESTNKISYFDFPDKKFIMEPDVYAEYRFYYNFNRRVKQQRKTANNSADYFFGRTEFAFPPLNKSFYNLFFLQGWGGRRSVSKKILFDYYVAVTEHFYFNGSKNDYQGLRFEPITTFSFSYVF